MTADTGRENVDQTLTLLHVRKIHRYNDWVFSLLAPHVRGRVFEMGCGIGTYSARLRPLATHFVCANMNPSYVATVRELLGADPGVSVRVSNLLVAASRILETVLRLPLGLTLVAAGRSTTRPLPPAAT